MNARVMSAALTGVEASLVEVEVDLVSSLPMFSTVGLAEGAVRESKERVRSAIRNSGFSFPAKRITVNLAPAGMPKVGTSYDLPIAVGILLEGGAVREERLSRYLLVGELSLDGRLRPVKGSLPIACLARREGFEGVLLPACNANEAAVVEGVSVLPVETLKEVIDFLNGDLELTPARVDVAAIFDQATDYPVDLADVRGQKQARRALEVAAAGGHNLLMIGPPGSGKTMLARRVPSILPPMSFEEALETTKVYSVLGLVPHGKTLLVHRPFRAPHHTISDAGLIGGGSYPTPGELSLSHNGVLFLDEMPEFRRQVLEVMRQPLEEGSVVLARARWSMTYPSRVMLVATMNPCPCGHHGDTQRACICSPLDVERYRSRISGPLLDRIDLHVEVPAITYGELSGEKLEESSGAIKARVCRARSVQRSRLESLGLVAADVHCNAQLTAAQLDQCCPLHPDARRLLEVAMHRLGLSARAYSRVLKVARTIADLDHQEELLPRHVGEAIQYRTLDRSTDRRALPAGGAA